MKKAFFLSSTALVSAYVAIFSPYDKPVQAAEGAGMEEIVVTGSYIKQKSQLDSLSPLNVISGENLTGQGLNTLGDIARTMSFSTGSEINTDAFTQNFSTGTANINLRGLGLSSTLVLLNGRRQTLSGAYADDGSTFVDTNSLMPMIMVERVETLKDGAAALYGTDAVAGVVNFITRDKFEGVEIQGNYQTTTKSAQQDAQGGAIFGGGNDRGHIVAAFNYMHRTALSAGDRDFTKGSGISASGQPGSFFGLIPGHPTFPVPDPFCAQGKNSFVSPIAKIGNTVIGTCNFDFSSYYSLVPREDNFQSYLTASYKLTDAVQFYLEGGFARNRATRENAPSFPIATPLFVSATHPGNPFGQNVLFLGRVLGGNAPASPSTHDSDTYRIVGGLKGDLAGSWTFDTDVTYSDNKFRLTVFDVKTDRYLAALAGHGGPNNNAYFNPFGTSLNATPGQVGVYNDPAVLADMMGQAITNAHTSLVTVDGHVTGDLFDLPAGPLGVAIGGQFRHEKMNYDWDQNYNAQNFLFLLGGPDFGASRSVGAGFAELSVPVLKSLQLQLAARYEDYGKGVHSFDPKAAILWRPVAQVSVRASAGTSFQAPSLFETNGSKTSLGNIIVGGQSIFRAIRTAGNPDLVPQSADVYNIGLTVAPVKRLSFNLDYWRFKYKHLIVEEDAQGIVNAALMGNPAALAKIEFTQTGDINLVHTDFINAPSVTTDGLDMSFAYTLDGDTAGIFIFTGDATYVHKYDAIDQNGVPFNGAGSRNFATFARSIPKWRGNLGLGWSLGGHNIQAYLRYIDGYHNNEDNTAIDSFTTVDLQYSYKLDSLMKGSKGTTLTIGSINLFNAAIPTLHTFGGFDSKVHDPRGRLVYVSLKQGF